MATDKQENNEFNEGLAAGALGIGLYGGGAAATYMHSQGFLKHLPDYVNNVQDLANKLPAKLKGDAAVFFDRFYKQPGREGKGYPRIRDDYGSSYRDASGARTDVKGSRLAKTTSPSPSVPTTQTPKVPTETVKPSYLKGPNGSNLGMQVKGGVAKFGSVGLRALGKGYLGVELASSFYNTSKDLIQSLQRGEGYAAIPGMVVDLLSSEEEQQAEPISIPDTPEEFQQKGLANIPPAEGMVNNPMYGQQTDLSQYQAAPEVEEELIPQKRPAMTVNPEDAIFEEPQQQTPSPVSAEPTPAVDPRNAEYIAARDALGPNSTPEQIKAVEDLGMSIHKSIYG